MMYQAKPHDEPVVLMVDLEQVSIGRVKGSQEITFCLSFALHDSGMRMAPIILTQEDARNLVQGLTEGLRAIQAGNN